MHSQRTRILVLEDDLATREVYQLALEDFGYEPVVVQGVDDAIHAIRAKMPEAAIVDYRLPGMPGTEFVKRVREQGFHDLPIIMVSASVNLQAEAQALGVSRFLLKPFEIEDLIGAIGSAHAAA